jgi:hypothetical protein
MLGLQHGGSRSSLKKRLLIVDPFTRPDHEALAVSVCISRPIGHTTDPSAETKKALLPKVGSVKTEFDSPTGTKRMHLEPYWTVLYYIMRIGSLDRNTEQGRI